MIKKMFPLLVLLGAVSLSIATAFAKRGGGWGPMTMYDSKTEMNVAGTVEKVTTGSDTAGISAHACCPEMGPGGTHFLLKTEKETIEVLLGPSSFLKEHKIEIVKGDTVEAVGSRVTIAGSPALIAREIRKGETSVALRDATGRPLWRMGHR